MAEPQDFLELLACPKCHGELKSVQAPEGFLCGGCKLFYVLDDGLPNMLIDEARAWPLASSA